MNCPHGCGNLLTNALLGYCPSCRRSLASPPEIVIAENEATNADGRDPMVARKPSWCWQWWGPPDHRMRCRLPSGHDGEHDTHEGRDSMIVATDGKLVSLPPSSTRARTE